MRQLNRLGEQAVIIQLLPFFYQNQNKMLGSEVSDNMHIIQKLGFPAKFTDFKIQNIVGSCDIKFPIRLEGLAFAHGHYSSVRFLISQSC